MARTDPSSGWSRPMSRRLAVGNGASVLLLGSSTDGRAQGTPEPLPRRPHPKPPSERDTSSWFVISRSTQAGYITQADRFEVYDGRSFELLGGFRSVLTSSIAVTADPARILLGTATGPSIFDLGTGNVTPVAWDVETAVESIVRLPDPRWATPTPPRWSFFWDVNYVRALLVDLDNATGVDLAEMLVKPGETAGYASLRFSPDGTRAAGSVAYNGYYVLDPESPADARLLDGGRDDMISWAPDFAPGSARLVYILREPGETPGEGTLVVEDLGSNDVVEIGPVGPDGFAVFPPDSDDELIVFDDGTVTRREIEGGREIWQAESEAVVLALGTFENTLFLGSARDAEGISAWQSIDLGSGDSRGLPDLRGLTYYNGSHVNIQSRYQLMGPPYGDGTEPITGRLAAVDLESSEVISLLDQIGNDSFSVNYGTSHDSGIILFAPSFGGQYHLFDLSSGEQRVVRYGASNLSAMDASVSADGTAAGVTIYDNSGSGRMDVWLLDVAAQGEPERFLEGRLWAWAGGAGPETTASGSGRVSTPTAYRAT